MPRGRRRRNNSALVRSAELIGWAIGGLEREIVETRSRLAALNAQAAKLRKRAGRQAGQALAEAGAAVKSGRASGRKMSSAGRARIAAAARRRWAKWRAENKK
jgi:hypothetical protein